MKAARILIVDDEISNIEVLTRVFAAQGHEITGAGNAEEAAATLSAETYDVVLLDQILPGATGMQSLGKLRTLTRAPIFMMSGNSDENTRQDALLLGAADFFAKPLDLPAIFAAIAALPEKQ